MYYDNSSQASDKRKNRKIVIFVSLQLSVPVHMFTFSNRKFVNRAGNLVFLAFSKSFCF